MYLRKYMDRNKDKKQFMIGALYIHPSGNVEHFVHDMDKVLSQVPKRLSWFLVGDMNIDLLEFENNKWKTDRTSAPKDHIFVKLNDRDRHESILAGNIPTDISGHLPFFLFPSVAPRSNQRNRPFVTILSEKNNKI